MVEDEEFAVVIKSTKNIKRIKKEISLKAIKVEGKHVESIIAGVYKIKAHTYWTSLRISAMRNSINMINMSI